MARGELPGTTRFPMAPGIAHPRCKASVVPDPRRRCGAGEVPPACAGAGVPGAWNGDDGMEVRRAVKAANRSATRERTAKGTRKKNCPFSAADASRRGRRWTIPYRGRILPVCSLLAPCDGRARHEYDAPTQELILARTPKVRATRIALTIRALDGAGRVRLLVGYTDREGQGWVGRLARTACRIIRYGDRVGEKSATRDRRCQRISCNAGTQSEAPTPVNTWVARLLREASFLHHSRLPEGAHRCKVA